MKVWRRELFGFGSLLIFAGIIISSYSNMVVEMKNIETPTVKEVYHQWNITGYFNEGEKLLLELPTNPEPPYEYGGFNISIVNQFGNGTVFYFEFVEGGKIKVSVLENNGALIINEEESLFSVSGVVSSSSNYTAYVDKLAMAWYKGPPRFLSLKKVIEEINLEYPHRGLLPFGVLLLFLGFILFGLSFRKSRSGRSIHARKMGDSSEFTDVPLVSDLGFRRG